MNLFGHRLAAGQLGRDAMRAVKGAQLDLAAGIGRALPPSSTIRP